MQRPGGKPLKRIRDALKRVFRSGDRPHPRGRRIEGIRARLGLAMALALLPFILLGLAQARGEYQRQSADLRADLQLAAQQSVSNATGLLGRTDTMLMVLGPEATSSYCSARLSILAQRLDDIQALYRIDQSGKIVCQSDDRGHDLLGDPAQSPWFRQLHDINADVPERIQQARGEPFVIQAQRVTRPLGGFDGVMVAVLHLDDLEIDPTVQGLPENSYSALFNTMGQPLTVERNPAFDPQIETVSDWMRDPSRDADLIEAVGTDGIRRVYARAPVTELNAYAVMAAPAASPWFWATNPIRFLMMPLAACLTAFAAVMFASERIVIRWLDYLDRIAAIYARGRYTVRPVQAENAPLEIRRLAQTMDELGDNVTHRDAALTEALDEKDALLREIHHRVKNNLQIISSLLSMQQRAVSDPAARAALGDTRQRISALALIYRTLYQGTDVRRADAEMFLNELVGHLVASESIRGPLVSSSVEADSLQIDPEKLAPMALWLVEAISNAQKHAFAERGGDLKVRFKVNGETSVLEVEDDGPGVEVTSPGVGLTLMTAFAKQLRGKAELVEAPSGGSIARLTFLTPDVTD